MTEVDIVLEAKALLEVPNRDKLAVNKDHTIAIYLNSAGGFFTSFIHCIYYSGKVKSASSTKSFFRYKSALNYFNELVKKYELEERVI